MCSKVGDEVAGVHAVQPVEQGVDAGVQVDQVHLRHVAAWGRNTETTHTTWSPEVIHFILHHCMLDSECCRLELAMFVNWNLEFKSENLELAKCLRSGCDWWHIFEFQSSDVIYNWNKQPCIKTRIEISNYVWDPELGSAIYFGISNSDMI